MLGEDSGISIYELSNSTSVNDTGFGIGCNDGSVADGRLRTLTGAAGAKLFLDASSADSLNYT